MRKGNPAAVAVAVLLFPVLAGAQAVPGELPVQAVPVIYEVQPEDQDVLLVQQFLPIDHDAAGSDPFGLPKGAVLPMSSCPDGWAPFVNEDGDPLYFPYGLMVDAEGKPDVGSYALIPACEKQ